MEDAFYSTAATAAFALLGLWWIVVAERYREWVELPHRRRQAYSVSLYFMLTGIMSVASLISTGQNAVWRSAFGIAGVLGLLETVAAIARARHDSEREGRVVGLLAITLPLYAIVVAVAFHPMLAHDLGVQLTPLATEAVLVSLLIFFGVNYAWLLFMEAPHERKSG